LDDIHSFVVQMEFSLSKLLVVSHSNDSVSLFRFTFYYGEVYTAV
jgi:hypothetical protein